VRTTIDCNYLHQRYIIEEKSIPEIASELGTYPNKVRRALIRCGIIVRDRSAAQSLALEKGRHKHPMKDRNHSAATKKRIGASVTKTWDTLSPDKKEAHAAHSKKNWQEKASSEKEIFRRKAVEGIKKASRQGSKLEKFLCTKLPLHGFDKVVWHAKSFIENEKLEVDILAIEVDGISHYEPIWGDDALKKQQRADAEKNSLLVESGYAVIRIKNTFKNASAKRYEDVLTRLVETLQYVIGKGESKQGIYHVDLE
jgi:hypothetical protein